MDISDVFSIYEQEKRRKNKLEKLNENFYKEIHDLIKKYSRLLELGEDEEEIKRLQLEIDNLKELVKQIVNLRLGKIINLALFEARENIKVAERSDMTKEERVLFDLISSIIKGFYEGVLYNIYNAKSPSISPILDKIEPIIRKSSRKIDKVMLRFKQEFSQIVGPDGKLYGPFAPEEVYILPKEIAKRLLELGICEKIEFKLLTS